MEQLGKEKQNKKKEEEKKNEEEKEEEEDEEDEQDEEEEEGGGGGEEEEEEENRKRNKKNGGEEEEEKEEEERKRCTHNRQHFISALPMMQLFNQDGTLFRCSHILRQAVFHEICVVLFIQSPSIFQPYLSLHPPHSWTNQFFACCVCPVTQTND